MAYLIENHRKTQPHKGYEILKQILKLKKFKDYFIVTDNVDGVIQKAGNLISIIYLAFLKDSMKIRFGKFMEILVISSAQTVQYSKMMTIKCNIMKNENGMENIQFVNVKSLQQLGRIFFYMKIHIETQSVQIFKNLYIDTF